IITASSPITPRSARSSPRPPRVGRRLGAGPRHRCGALVRAESAGPSPLGRFRWADSAGLLF
ncbi:MAG: hypothetical protein ACKOJF_09825, partial [Planctomycetaceae bacterium]